MNKLGRPTYLSPGEESLLVAKEEIEGYHGLPTNTAMISAELKYVVASLKERAKCKKITHNSASKYCCAVKNRVNVSKEAHDKQSKKSRTGFIKVSSQSNNRDNQSDTILDWMMFHKINHMYRDITKQNEQS